MATHKDKHADRIEGWRPYSEWLNRFAMIEQMVLFEMNPLSAGRSIKEIRTIATELGWRGKI